MVVLNILRKIPFKQKIKFKSSNRSWMEKQTKKPRKYVQRTRACVRNYSVQRNTGTPCSWQKNFPKWFTNNVTSTWRSDWSTSPENLSGTVHLILFRQYHQFVLRSLNCQCRMDPRKSRWRDLPQGKNLGLAL